MTNFRAKVAGKKAPREVRGSNYVQKFHGFSSVSYHVRPFCVRANHVLPVCSSQRTEKKFWCGLLVWGGRTKWSSRDIWHSRFSSICRENVNIIDRHAVTHGLGARVTLLILRSSMSFRDL